MLKEQGIALGERDCISRERTSRGLDLEPGDHPIRIHHTNSHRIDSTLDSYSTSILEMIHTRSNRSLVFATGTRFFLVIPPRDSANQIKPDQSRPRNEMAAGRQITQYILRNIRDYRRLKLPVYSPRVVFSFQASPSRPSLFTLWRTVRWTPLRRSRTARLSVSVCKSALGTLRTALWGTRISPST